MLQESGIQDVPQQESLAKQPSGHSTPDSNRTSDQQAHDVSTAVEQIQQEQESLAAEVAPPDATEGSDGAGAAALVACSSEVLPSTQCVSAGGVSLGQLARKVVPQLPLPHLLQLELDGCRIDDETMTALLKASPALRALEIAGLEGLTDAGLKQVSTLQHLTRLCVEAENTPAITLASLSHVRRLHRLKKLHWCTRDSLHGPMDTDLLTAQLSGLTGLRQLVLLVAPDAEAYANSGWTVVLQRRLPLCRLVLRRELVVLDAWADTPSEE